MPLASRHEQVGEEERRLTAAQRVLTVQNAVLLRLADVLLASGWASSKLGLRYGGARRKRPEGGNPSKPWHFTGSS